TVGLASSASAVAPVPAAALVPQGALGTDVALQTVDPVATTSVTFGATLGATTLRDDLTVDPLALQSITVNPVSVVGGGPSMAMVTLNGNVPTGGVHIQVSSSQPSVVQLASSDVFIAAGQS